MISNEKLYLNLNDFENHVQTTWENLQTDQDFCDVTLICNDNQIRSHKFILSSYSPIFNNMLKKSNQNPMIYLSGVKYADLENILNFIYQGEVNVSREDVNSFLMVANDLKIRGLFLEEENVNLSQNASLSEENYNAKLNQDIFIETQSNGITQDINKFSQKYPDEKLQQISPLQTSAVNINNDNPDNVDGNKEKYNVKLCQENKSMVNTQNIKKFSENCQDEKLMSECNVQNYDEIKTKTLQTDVLNDLTNAQDNKNVDNLTEINPNYYSCNKCNTNFITNEALTSHMQTHQCVFQCDHCNFTSNGKTEIDRHKKIHHEVHHPCTHCDFKTVCDLKLKKHMKYNHFCDQCDFKASKYGILKSHKYRNHTDKYNCKECSYKADENSRLRDHFEALHGNTQHVCDECGYKTTTNKNLLRHKNENHKGTIYFCDQCDYKSKSHRTLKRHMDIEHKGIRFPCSQCDFKATQKNGLKRHINSHYSSNPSVITKLKNRCKNIV